MVSSLMSTLNLTIKSVASSVLASQNDRLIIERALLRIFSNLSYSV